MLRSQNDVVAEPTYLEFFGLRRPPFVQVAEPSELFHAEQYSLLLEHLGSAGKRADALVVIRGADGSGKSTLLRQYVAGLDDEVHFVAIDGSCPDEKLFYGECLAQIGFRDITGSADELRHITREFFLARGNAGDHVLIIIDNAHLMSSKILEQLRLLSDIKIKSSRVISVILAGSPGILRALDASALSRADFHSHVVFNIRNFTETETANYVWHRLRLAGAADAVKLSTAVYSLIHRYSGGTPRMINELCDYLLAQACEAGSRVITEKIVRTVADANHLLPHVNTLHGKGRRKSDPDFKPAHSPSESDERISIDEPNTDASGEANAATTTTDDADSWRRHISLLSGRVDELQADKMRALDEVRARDEHIARLRDELNSKTSEIRILSHSLKSNADEFVQQNQQLATRIEALKHSEGTAEELAGKLEQETRSRETAEASLKEASATIEKLGRQNAELLATVDALRAETAAVGERAAEADVLAEHAAQHEAAIEAMQRELDALQKELASRDKIVADLELRLKKSQSACELAQRRILELKSPQELEEIERNSEQLAVELAREKDLRETAEDELASLTASVDDLGQQNQELQATVQALQSELEAGEKQAARIDALEKHAADLEGEVEEHQVELDVLRADLASRDRALADLENDLEASRQECAAAQQRVDELETPNELKEVEKASAALAADLKQQTRLRETAEEDLARARAEIEELGRHKLDLQTSVEELEADLKAAAEQAVEVEALEKRSVAFQDEVASREAELEALREELASRDKALAELEEELSEMRQEYGSAQQRILEQMSPEEVEEIENASKSLAADLERESRLRDTAEGRLAKATARIDELSREVEAWQAAARDLHSDPKSPDEGPVGPDTLRKSVSALQAEVDRKTGELDARNKAFADIEKQLAVLLNRRELQTPRAAASTDTGELPVDADQTVSLADAPTSSSLVVRRFEQSISDVPAYQSLRKHDPAAYKRLIATYKRFIGLDHSDKQVNDLLRAEQAKLLEKLLPKAADKAIFAYAEVIVDQLDEFLHDGTEPCLTMLVPPGSRGKNALPVFSEKTKQRELEVLDSTLRTFDEDRQLPSDEDVLPDVQPILAELVEAYGEENVAAIGNTGDSGIDRVLLCEISRRLYSRLLELPKRKSARALRWILSS